MCICGVSTQIYRRSFRICSKRKKANSFTSGHRDRKKLGFWLIVKNVLCVSCKAAHEICHKKSRVGWLHCHVAAATAKQQPTGQVMLWHFVNTCSYKNLHYLKKTKTFIQSNFVYPIFLQMGNDSPSLFQLNTWKMYAITHHERVDDFHFWCSTNSCSALFI